MRSRRKTKENKMDELFKTLVKIADQLDLKGKSDLAAKVDETIAVLAARPKSSKPLKKMDEHTKDELFKFLAKACKNTEETVASIEELMRRLRYFGVDGDVKGLKLEMTLKDARDLNALLSNSAHKLHELTFGRKMPKDAMKGEEQESKDPFAFAAKNTNSKAQQAKKIIEHAKKALGPDLGGHSALDLLADNMEAESLDELRKILTEIGYKDEKPTEEEMSQFWEETKPDIQLSKQKEVITYVFDDKVAIMEDGSKQPYEYADGAVKIAPVAWWVSFDDANTGYKINEAGYFGPFKTREEANMGALKAAEKLGFKVVPYEESNYGKKNG